MNADRVSGVPSSNQLPRKLWRWGPALCISLAALFAAPWLVGPRCPDRISIATGGKDGAYFAFAQRYRDILAPQGITLDVIST